MAYLVSNFFESGFVLLVSTVFESWFVLENYGADIHWGNLDFDMGIQVKGPISSKVGYIVLISPVLWNPCLAWLLKMKYPLEAGGKNIVSLGRVLIKAYKMPGCHIMDLVQVHKMDLLQVSKIPEFNIMDGIQV